VAAVTEVMVPKRPGPRTLEDVRDKDPGAEMLYPRHVLRDAETALCAFSAAFYGTQDAYWLSEAGLRTTCVDIDQVRLDEMRSVYPPDWEFVCGDAFETWIWSRGPWDIVSLDPFTSLFERCAAELPMWCSLARQAVILGCASGQVIEAPDGWMEVRRVFRSDYGDGVEWAVFQPKGVGVTPDKVSAVLITRGDVDLDPILETLPYDDVVVWNGRERQENNPGTFGRYEAMREAKHDVIYVQDDDCVFRHHEELCAGYDPGRITAVYGHGETPDGLGDMALIHGGALVDRDVSLAAFDRYLERWPMDEGFYREADMIHGTLVPFRHLHLPYEIRLEIAQHPSRMCNQPWQRDLKHMITDRARQVRAS
jgi:hypothetical protein